VCNITYINIAAQHIADTNQMTMNSVFTNKAAKNKALLEPKLLLLSQ